MTRIENAPNWVKIVTGLLVFFLPIVLYAVQVPFFQSCLNLERAMLIYGVVGALLGLGVGIYFLRKAEEDFHKLQLAIAGIVIGFFLFPLIAVLLNRATAFGGPSVHQAAVVSVHGYEQSRFGDLGIDMEVDGFYIYVILDQEIERLHAESEEDIKDLVEGSEVEVLVSRGLLGLKWGELITKAGSS